MAKRTTPGEPMAWLEAMIAEWRSNPTPACITDWPYSRTVTRCFYPRVWWKGHVRVAHHVVLELTGRPRPAPPRDIARHLCTGSKAGCLQPDHLAWGTYAENEADKLVHGWSNRGERHGMSKLTEDDVRQIRSRYRTGTRWDGQANARELAKEFGVCYEAVRDIVNGKRWNWLD